MNSVPSRKQSLSCLFLVIYPSHFKILKNSWFPLLFLNIALLMGVLIPHMKFAFEAAGGDFVLLVETSSLLFISIISSRVSIAYFNCIFCILL